jgi:hypothetical protein
MTTHPAPSPSRRLRATIIGLGLDGSDNLHRLITGKDYLLIGGSAETHAEMVDKMLRLDAELERIGRRLGDVSPTQLAEIAVRIDLPELQEIAVRLKRGLERIGLGFHESTPEQLTQLSVSLDV